MNAWKLRVLSQLQETLPAVLDGLPPPKPLLRRTVPHLTQKEEKQGDHHLKLLWVFS